MPPRWCESWQRHARFGVPLFVWVSLILNLLGCATGSLPAPRTVLLDREVETARRTRALDQLTAEGLGGQDITALHQVVWSDRQPDALRLGSADALIAHRADDFWAVAARRLVTVDRLPVLRHLCERAAATGRRDMTGPLVRSWARPTTTIPDDKRPEALALRQLHPDDDLTAMLWSVLRDAAEGYTLSEETAAWVVLCRLDTPAAVEALSLEATLGRDTLVRDLRQCAAAGVTLPTRREGVLWLTHLTRQAEGAAWRRLTEALPDPDPTDPTDPIALRHLPMLAAAPVSRRSMPRGEVLGMLDEALRGRPNHPRGLDAEGEVYVGPLIEGWADHRASITRADALLLLTIIAALPQPHVRDALFAQADADRADSGAEHGGGLLWAEDGRVIAQPFATYLNRNDHVYVSSYALIESMYTGLAHYHFHAQRYDNAAYAGPGPGDLAFAHRMGFACVVLTFVNADTLAVDVYFPDGTVVDVGVLARPGVAR